MLFIWDLSKSCGMEVYRVETSNVWMKVALQTPKWPNDDSKFVEFFKVSTYLGARPKEKSMLGTHI